MKILNVSLTGNVYPVVVGHDVLDRLADFLVKNDLGTEAVIITNKLVNKLHGVGLSKVLQTAGIQCRFLFVADSEKSKSFAVALKLIDHLVCYSVNKKCFVIAFGGGVIGDLAGFVSAITKRGVPFVQVPTTLLAQIDASIGGKVAVDLPAGKNLVGTFYHPRIVLADMTFLKTLSQRQIRNGLAEAVKYGVIADEVLFSLLEKEYARLLDNDVLWMMRVVVRCVAIKARMVATDEKETKGLRTILNFGHTVGHAIESASGYARYQHGEAVALGMRIAVDISVQLGLLKQADAVRIGNLLTALGLPEEIEECSFSRIMTAMKFDKKFSGKNNRFVLACGIGKVVVREDVPVSVISGAIKKFLCLTRNLQ